MEWIMYFGTCVKMKDYEDAKKEEAGLCAMTQNFHNISLNMVKNVTEMCAFLSHSGKNKETYRHSFS